MASTESVSVPTEERVREIVLQVVEEVVEPIRRELGQPSPEWSDVRQVWLAIGALTDAQRRTEERLEELAEAQRRTEERVEQLAEAQRRTEERLQRLEETVQALAEAQRRTEERLQRLEEVVYSLAETVRQLVDRLERVEKQLGQLSDRLGMDLETDAEEVLWALAESKGIRFLQRPTPITMDGEIDWAAPVEMPDGKRYWLLVEVKGRLRRKELSEWVQCLRDPSFQQKLRLYGVEKPYLPYVFGMRVYLGVEEMAQEVGVGILTFRGEQLPPRPWE